MKPLREIKIKSAVIAVLCAAGAALATDLTWIGAVPSDWNNPANWNPQQVPTASDHVVINSGSVTAPTDAAFAFMDWTGGTISGSLTVASNAVLSISGSSLKELGIGGTALTNAGTIYWSGTGNLKFGDYGSTLVNLSGALFEIQNDQTMVRPFCCAEGVFLNAGLLRKTGSSGITSVDILSTNLGLVDVQSGKIQFNRGGGVGGQYTTATGTGVDFAGNFTQMGSPLFSGAGHSRFIYGELTLVSDVIPGLELVGGWLWLGPAFQGGSITNLTLPSGITLMGHNRVTGTMNWTGGDIGASYGASLTVASNAVLSISGSSLKELGIGGTALTNAGTIYWSGTGNLKFGDYGSTLVNLSGALFEIQNDQTMTIGAFAESYFLNAGVLRKTGGSGTTVINVISTNQGVVEARMGTVSFARGFSSTGLANLATSLGGPTLGSGYGHLHFDNPLVLSGTFSLGLRNGFRPNPGDTFSVLGYPSATGAFTCFSGLDLGGGLLLVPQFSETGLSLLATTYATNSSLPELFITRAPGSVLVTWPQGFPDWVLMFTTNLGSAAWSPFPLQCDSQATVPTSEPARFFQLRKTN